MNKLYLHIGPHKTGSTFVQKHFFENQEENLERGLSYRLCGDDVYYGHHGLAQAFLDASKDELSETLDEYILSPEHTILCSSENFDRVKQESRKELLRQELSRFDAHAVYVYRHYTAMLPSWWQEHIKHGGTSDFFQFSYDHISRPFQSEILNPRVVLDYYAELVGFENIHVIDYQKACAEDNYLDEIYDLLGFSPLSSTPSQINKSLAFDSVELIRVLNQIFVANRQQASAKIRSAVLARESGSELDGLVEELLSEISTDTLDVKVGGDFFESAVVGGFLEKYGRRFVNGISDASSSNRITIPTSGWVFRDGVEEKLRRTYQLIAEAID